MTRPVEVQARRYLRLFPTWMRADRGEEVLGLVLDQVPSDAAQLPLRSRGDLIRAGFHARRIGRPPMKVRWAVANAAPNSSRGTVPPAWRPWLLDGLPRRSFAVRMALRRTAMLFVSLLAMSVVTGGDADRLPGGVTVLLLWAVTACSSAGGVDRWRSVLYLQNGLHPDGRPIAPTEPQEHWTSPALANAWIWPAILAVEAVFLVAAVGSWPAFGDPGDGIVLFWFVVALTAISFVVAADNLIGYRLSHPTSAAVSGAPRRRWSRRVALTAATCAAVAMGVVLVVSFAAGIFGLAPLGRWTLVVAGALAVRRFRVEERRQARALGLWDLFPSLGPVRVLGAGPLPPPPQAPDRPALG